MPISFRPATAADLDSIFLLMQQMQIDDPWSEPFNESAVRHNLLELLTNPIYGVVHLALDANTSIAYLVICFDFSLEYRGKGAWIDELFVLPTHRGKGIGTKLLDLAESSSRQHAAYYLHLEVTHGNPAIDLYRRRGFQDHHRYLLTKPLAKPL
jgi:ribosomal protein S18 acetylase RimI-like enzyme